MKNFSFSNGVSEMREKAFASFREFVHDANQTGDTLLSIAPMRYAATRSLSVKRGSITRQSYKDGVKVAATSLLIPTELCWAAGYVPFNWEMYASLLASHSAVIDVTNKGSVTSPRCSFINCLKGAYVEGILAKPDVVVASTAYCEAIGYGIEEVASSFGLDHHHLDIPVYSTESTVNTFATQLCETYLAMCAQNDIDEEQALVRFRKAMTLSTQARSLANDIWEMRKAAGPLDLGLEPLHWHIQFMPLWGDEAGVRFLTRLKEELAITIEEKKGEKPTGIPVGIFGLMPYGRTNIWKKLRENGAYVVFEGVNYMGRQQILEVDTIESLSLHQMMQNVAYNLINVPIRGGKIEDKIKIFMEDAAAMGTQGMIIFSHEHCQMLCPRLSVLEQEATNHGMSAVSISGDCILGMPPGPSGIRLGTFLDGLRADSNLEQLEIEMKEVLPESAYDDYRLGVDFGSGYSKYVILDEKQQIFKRGIFNSGIDYPSLLNEIRSAMPADKQHRLAISGVGGDNPKFKDIATQTTEISALIGAVRNLFAKQGKMLVIDIGTQDVKILKFADMNQSPWINTNKSCGAGTGLVLAQILERWKQSKPEMTFATLDELAQKADKVEMINTTCGIFAVTSVVSALVQADDSRRCEILRGVYQYIAMQAIKLLPLEDQHGGDLFLTGGIANHASLRDIFKQRGFNLLTVPADLHPQFLVAYGTALCLD